MNESARLCAALTGLILGVSLVLPARAADVLLASGATDSVYFEIGRAICRLVNRAGADTSCTAVATDGPRFNLANVRSGAFEFALVLSDLHYHAVNGTGPYAYVDESYDAVRSVMSLHAEPFTLVATRGSGVRNFADLEGKRVNIGNPGSRQRQAMDALMEVSGWTSATFTLAEELPADQQSLALCHGRVEAMVYVVGHPHASVAQAATLCDAVLADVAAGTVARLTSAHPYYTAVEIPGGIYPGITEPVDTFGVRMTLVTSADVEDEVVYAVVAAIGENLERLRRLHPLLGPLEPRSMVSDGLFAPLHEGAARYYRERGWLE